MALKLSLFHTNEPRFLVFVANNKGNPLIITLHPADYFDLLGRLER